MDGVRVLVVLGHVRVGVVSAEASEHVLHARRQRLECEVLVGEERVTAERWNLLGVQQRDRGGRLLEADVAVPVLAPEGLDLVGLLQHLQDRGALRYRGEEGMDVGVAEVRGELHVLGGIELLVVEGQHEMLDQEIVDERELFVVGVRDLDP